VVLALGALVLGVLVGLGLVLESRLSILGAAGALALVAAGTVLVPALLPRMLLFFWALVAVVGIVKPLFWDPVQTLAGILGAFLAALGVWRRPPRVLAVVCALIGGWLVVQSFGLDRGWVLLTSAVLFAFQEIHRLRWQEPRLTRRPRGPAAVAAMSAAIATAAGVLLLPRLVDELPNPPEATGRAGLPPIPFAERRALVRQEAPRGGLVWALPSEALNWDEAKDRELYPRIERLDARFLGAEVRGMRRLPGTDPLLGAFSLHPAIARLRRVPDAAALARMRAAALATAAALAEVAPRARDDLPESELARLLEEAMAARGCERGSFPPIVASGDSVGDGHGSGNRGKLVNGTLVVIDIGCRVGGYVSDFTRTLPVGGTYPPALRPFYDAVLEAQTEAARACRAGVFLAGGRRRRPPSLDAIAREVLVRRLGRDPMTHGLGHTVGLFVHDVPTGGPLQPGMVITIEPGAYGPRAGLRIEDMYLVTETGCERLTEGFPADPERVEAAMAQRR
jgi:Xaa-Pro aminopeptidase